MPKEEEWRWRLRRFVHSWRELTVIFIAWNEDPMENSVYGLDVEVEVLLSLVD